MKKILTLVALLALFASSAFATALDKDTIIVGTGGGDYPPYAFYNEKGELDGFDLEIAKIVVERLGKKAEWLDTAFDALLPTLMAGKVDMAIAAFSPTEERKKRVNFSESYEVAYSVFMTKIDGHIESVDDLKGKTVAIPVGTIQEAYIRTLEGLGEIRTFQKFDDCLREVALGRADATLMSVPVANAFLEAKDFTGKVKIAFNSSVIEEGAAIAVNKKDPELTDAISAIIIDMEKSGELPAIRKKWGLQ